MATLEAESIRRCRKENKRPPNCTEQQNTEAMEKRKKEEEKDNDATPHSTPQKTPKLDTRKIKLRRSNLSLHTLASDASGSEMESSNTSSRERYVSSVKSSHETVAEINTPCLTATGYRSIDYNPSSHSVQNSSTVVNGADDQTNIDKLSIAFKVVPNPKHELQSEPPSFVLNSNSDSNIAAQSSLISTVMDRLTTTITLGSSKFARSASVFISCFLGQI